MADAKEQLFPHAIKYIWDDGGDHSIDVKICQLNDNSLAADRTTLSVCLQIYPAQSILGNSSMTISKLLVRTALIDPSNRRVTQYRTM